MSDSKSSGNLSKGDIISFVALLLMGVLVFFGMNFMTLGDRIPSIVVAILTVVLMTVFVFLAAYAKGQVASKSAWTKIQYAMVALYVLGLIPCYIFSAKFFDVQFGKDNIMKQVQSDTNDLNKLFADYSRKCESRASAYQIDLEAMMKSSEGRVRIAQLLDIKDPSSITEANINQAVSSFSKNLKGAEFRNLEADKDNLVSNCESNFNNWNIMLIPQYAYELGMAKMKYASELERIYGKTHNDIERNIPEFETERYINESGILDTFKSTGNFSFIGLIVVLFLGLLGFAKYLLAEKSDILDIPAGDSSVINRGGGFTYNQN